MYEKVADKIYFIEGENKGRDPYSNSLLIDDQSALQSPGRSPISFIEVNKMAQFLSQKPRLE